jgi:hypothetical protein
MSDKFKYVPSCLRQRSSWCATRLTEREGKLTKPPFRVSDGNLFDGWKPETSDLASFDEALKSLDRFDYLGFCVSDSPFLCSDLDHCFTEKDELKSWAKEYIDTHQSSVFYAERSPSKDGLHLWHDTRTMKLKDAADKKLERKFDGGKIELFFRNYCTVTGDAWGEFSGVCDRESLDKLRAFFVKPERSEAAGEAKLKADQKFALLMNGKIAEAGFSDPTGDSAADLFFCGYLAKKKLNRETVRQIWLSSGLKRPKQQRQDYVESTLDRAFRDVKNEPADEPVKLVASKLSNFKTKEVNRKPPLLTSAADPQKVLVSRPAIIQIHAFRGTGKSNTAFYLADALASGGKFLRWRSSEPLRVLYVEGEQPDADLQEQLKLLAPDGGDNLEIMTLEQQEGLRFPKIVTPAGQASYETYLIENKVNVLFLDSLSTLANIPMNEEEQQILLSDWFIHLRALGISVIYLQHDGKTGSQRGHTKHEDWINLSIQLSWPEGYHGQNGLRVYFKFDKVRRYGAETDDLLVELMDGEWTWKAATEAQDKRQSAAERATELLNENPNMSIEEVCRKLKAARLSFKTKDMKDMVSKIKKQMELPAGEQTDDSQFC